ncbi:peptide ABC transporter ATP-binding protein, partial [bacterium E08(2017)]
MLEIDDLRVCYGGEGGQPVLKAVDGVSLSVAKGASIGLVGESGCGKSSLANAILGLVDVASGTIKYEGNDVTGLKGSDLNEYRTEVQMIFQDPQGSLNPRLSIGGCLAEVCKLHGVGLDQKTVEGRVAELLDMVGLEPGYAGRYPHEFSGGQRQRIGIARALAVNPSLIIADEPVSALDVSVQVQILNLMKSLQERMNL